MPKSRSSERPPSSSIATSRQMRLPAVRIGCVQNLSLHTLIELMLGTLMRDDEVGTTGQMER